MNAIEIKGLTKSYGAFKLDWLDLTLPCGCIMGLVGENGAGKSTTIRLMLGMARPDGGTICLRGRDGKELAGRRAAARLPLGRGHGRGAHGRGDVLRVDAMGLLEQRLAGLPQRARLRRDEQLGGVP